MEINKGKNFRLNVPEEDSVVVCFVRNNKTERVEGTFYGKAEEICALYAHVTGQLKVALCREKGLPEDVAGSLVMSTAQVGVMFPSPMNHTKEAAADE